MALPKTTWASLLPANALSLKVQILRYIKMVKPKATLSIKLPKQTFSLFQDQVLLGSEDRDVSLLEDRMTGKI